MSNREAALSELQPIIRDVILLSGRVRDFAESGDYAAARQSLSGLDEARVQLERGLLDVMRADGWTWQKIGAELGISRQAAWERHRLAAS